MNLVHFGSFTAGIVVLLLIGGAMGFVALWSDADPALQPVVETVRGRLTALVSKSPHAPRAI